MTDSAVTEIAHHVTDLEVAGEVKLETNELLDVSHGERRRTEEKMPESNLSASKPHHRRMRRDKNSAVSNVSDSGKAKVPLR